jgi:hypothetical protein
MLSGARKTRADFFVWFPEKIDVCRRGNPGRQIKKGKWPQYIREKFRDTGNVCLIKRELGPLAGTHLSLPAGLLGSGKLRQERY